MKIYNLTQYYNKIHQQWLEKVLEQDIDLPTPTYSEMLRQLGYHSCIFVSPLSYDIHDVSYWYMDDIEYSLFVLKFSD